MNEDKLSRKWLWGYALGLIPVFWLALLIAPYMDGGLPKLIANADAAFANPFAIQWCEDTPRTILILSMIYMVCIGIYLSDDRNYRRREEYGSAKWGSVMIVNGKYSTKKDEDPFFNKILTQNVRISFWCWRHRRNLNILVIGGSGAGKTRFYVIPNVLNANSSFIILDPKGEILRTTGNVLKQKGYKIKVLDLVHMEKSHCYNLFHYIKSIKDIQVLVTNIFAASMPKGAQSQDPFWDNAASILLKAIICLLWLFPPKEEQNFDMVMEVLRSAQIKEEDEDFQSPMDVLFEKYREEEPDNVAVKFYDDYKKAAGKTAKSINITLLSKLEKFNIPELAQLTMTDELELDTIGQEKTALFAVIPDSDTSFNFLVSILYNQLFQILFDQADQSKNGRLPVHVHFVMDEFANIALPNDFQNRLATMRSREISVSIILQNLSQLKALYEKDWESIVGNCDEFLYLGGNEQGTHEYISKLLGKETIDTNTYGKSKGRNGSYSTNYQSTGRELKTPDEMRTFDNDTALLFIRGERPIQDRKYDLTKHPNYHLTPEGGGEPYLHDRDSRSFASITLDQSLLDQAAQWDIDTTSFVLLSEEELEESFQEKENENHESVPEKRKLPHRKYPRPRQG